jgi:hypothetical protein
MKNIVIHHILLLVVLLIVMAVLLYREQGAQAVQGFVDLDILRGGVTHTVPAQQPGKSWDDMKKICDDIGQRVCSVGDVCNQKKVIVQGLPQGHGWMAVGDRPNEWLAWDTSCRTHTEQQGGAPAWGLKRDAQPFSRMVKCCPKSTPAPPPMASILQGRFIRIDMGQVGCLNLGEIAVMSEKDGPNIIRPSMVVSTSSSYGNNAYPGANFVDQKPDTFVHTSCSDKGWVIVDLGSMVPIYQIVVTNRTDCCRQRANGAVLTILNDRKEILYTADPIRNKAGSMTNNEADNSTNDRSFYTFTYFPPTPAVIGSDTAFASKPSIKCGPNNFCIGMRNNLPHCYGKKEGCLWGANDCTKDSDCSKYTEASPAYTDNRSCDQFKLGDWPYDACPAATANFDVRVAPNQPSKSYQDMKRVCENKGKKLCRSSDICNKSRQVAMAGLTSAFTNDNWIAVGDKDNEWLTLNRAGDRYCKTHTEVAGSVPSWGTSAAPGGWERLAKCCPT